MSTEPTPPTTTATAPTAPATPAPATAPNPAPPPAPPAEPNALATALSSGWEQFTKGELISYRLMALILVVVAAVGTTIYITRSNFKVASALWADFDSLNGSTSVSSLKEFAGKNPDTVPGRLAELELARALLGPDGIERFNSPDAAKRKEAVANVEQARDSFVKLAEAFKDDPVLKAVCWQGAAKAEASLVGMTKEGTTQRIGDPNKAVEYLDKVAEAAPDTDWGKDAKKLADILRNKNTQDQVFTLQASVYTIEKPTDPSLAPKAPTGGLPGVPVP